MYRHLTFCVVGWVGNDSSRGKAGSGETGRSSVNKRETQRINTHNRSQQCIPPATAYMLAINKSNAAVMDSFDYVIFSAMLAILGHSWQVSALKLTGPLPSLACKQTASLCQCPHHHLHTPTHSNTPTCQFFFSRETRKLTLYMMLVLICASSMLTLATATPRHSTFFSWNLMDALVSFTCG